MLGRKCFGFRSLVVAIGLDIVVVGLGWKLVVVEQMAGIVDIVGIVVVDMVDRVVGIHLVARSVE